MKPPTSEPEPGAAAADLALVVEALLAPLPPPPGLRARLLTTLARAGDDRQAHERADQR
jgi:hypothetical protein